MKHYQGPMKNNLLLIRPSPVISDFRPTLFEDELKKSRSQLLNLSSQIVTHESSVDHMRLKRIDRQAKQEALKDMMSKVSYFESQLGMETVGLNKLMTKNRHMREEMESLLRERERFKRQLDELLSRLSAGKAFIHDLMEQGTVAFEHREEAQGKLLLLRRKRVVLQEKHGQGMRDLERELEDNIRSAVFMTKKGQERGGNAARAEEEENKRQLMQGEVRRLEKVLEKILDYFPDISDPNAMADLYLVQEDENFAIFNYVNEVNCEGKCHCSGYKPILLQKLVTTL
ncbi:unnamed protein product [Nezara viridula]|uniref:ODAD1 central coiled coil region domain-containing protein n=1 Tax=Nezara viridula TaxID=85310 RepID=A0A9P0H126_NEZVI|nr:unnamed protein product [Nezara viridula]